MLKIGTLTLENWLVMAPMAGITNLPFRLIVKKMGAALVTSEMVSAMGLSTGQEKSHGFLESHAQEKPLAVQIFGCRPDIMASASQIAVEAGASLVDINMGCPVKKVVKTGAGASLLRNPKKVEEIVSAVRLACSVPLTVKIRAGWSPDNPVACEIARLIEDCGADAITIHPRFASDGFSGKADWRLIGKVKKRVKIPVIGNGDVIKPSNAFTMKSQTGCDGVMIGREAVGNPWIFKQILCMEKGLPIPEPDVTDRRSLILEHYHLLSSYRGEHRAALSMRKLLVWYTRGLPHSSQFRGSINQIRDLESLIVAMDNYFTTCNLTP